MANPFKNQTSSEYWVLSSKLMAGAQAADAVHGNAGHELVMEIYDSISDVQDAYPGPGAK